MQWLHVIVWRITYLHVYKMTMQKCGQCHIRSSFFLFAQNGDRKRQNVTTSQRRRQRVRQRRRRRRLVKRFYRESRESHIELMNDFLHFVQQSLKCWLQEEIFILIRASLILHCFHPQCCHLVTGVDKWSSTYKTKLEMLTPGASSRDINSVTRWIVCSFNIRPFTKTKKSTYL